MDCTARIQIHYLKPQADIITSLLLCSPLAQNELQFFKAVVRDKSKSFKGCLSFVIAANFLRTALFSCLYPPWKPPEKVRESYWLMAGLHCNIRHVIILLCRNLVFLHCRSRAMHYHHLSRKQLWLLWKACLRICCFSCYTLTWEKRNILIHINCWRVVETQ